jgi:HK97 family phage prohead protease
MGGDDCPARFQDEREEQIRRIAAERNGVEYRSATAVSKKDLELPANEPTWRSAPLTEGEVKGNLFVGYAAVYGAIAQIGEAMTESVSYGAFGEVLDRQTRTGPSIPFLYNHDKAIPPMGHTEAGTLRLSADTRGLHTELDLPKHHPYVGMLREQVERGEVKGMSWGFAIGDHSNYTVESRGRGLHREIHGFHYLLDVSPTWAPAYAGADHGVEIRSYDQPMAALLSNKLRLEHYERELRLGRLALYSDDLRRSS